MLILFSRISDFDSKDDSEREFDLIDVSANNQTALEAITEKLTEVTELAEEVDQALFSAQQDCAISTTSSSTSTATTTISVTNMNRGDSKSVTSEVGSWIVFVVRALLE